MIDYYEKITFIYCNCRSDYGFLGFFNRDGCEKLDITLEEFWQLHKDSSKGTAKLSATPFAELDDKIIEKTLKINQASTQK